MDETVAVFLGLFLFIIALFVFNYLYYGQKREKRIAESGADALCQSIKKTHEAIFGEGQASPSQQLNELHHWAKDTLAKIEQDYLKSKSITRTENTFSTIGICGVSKTHFYCGIDQQIRKYEPLQTRDNLCPTYEKFMQQTYASRLYDIKSEDIARLRKKIEQKLSLYLELHSSTKIEPAYVIALDDIRYFKIEGEQHFVSSVSGGGANLQGAAVGALIAGGAGAIIGSQLGTETTTQISVRDTRRITLLYRNGDEWSNLDIRSLDPEETIAAFRKLIPQKEDSSAQIDAIETAPMPQLGTSIEDLKKYKDLLDCGIITQEEFDAKKKQILGL